jgi:hypothetical protein
MGISDLAFALRFHQTLPEVLTIDQVHVHASTRYGLVIPCPGRLINFERLRAPTDRVV